MLHRTVIASGPYLIYHKILPMSPSCWGHSSLARDILLLASSSWWTWSCALFGAFCSSSLSVWRGIGGFSWHAVHICINYLFGDVKAHLHPSPRAQIRGLECRQGSSPTYFPKSVCVITYFGTSSIAPDFFFSCVKDSGHNLIQARVADLWHYTLKCTPGFICTRTLGHYCIHCQIFRKISPATSTPQFP